MARKPKMLITGAAGFIGRAACEHYRDLYEITAVDDRSRSTSNRHMPMGVEFVLSDAWRAAQGRGGFEAVIHLAAQVSVVSSLADPLNDFRRNAELTMRLSQWASQEKVGKFIYSSTNKVFGDLAEVRYPILDTHPIDPQTPYGISKAAGALYVREFLPNSGYAFHQSCICGEDQTGTEDQGWIGFLRRQIRDGKPITCYGDGKQIRDLLHVSDLLAAYDMALRGDLPPGSYGVGGGRSNAVSFAEAVARLGGEISHYDKPRPHDQQQCIMASDGLRLAGWEPQVDSRKWLVDAGLTAKDGARADARGFDAGTDTAAEEGKEVQL